MHPFSWPENLIERPVTIQCGTLGEGGGGELRDAYQGDVQLSWEVVAPTSKSTLTALYQKDFSWPIFIIHVPYVQDSNAVEIDKNQTEGFQSFPVIRKGQK